MEKLMRKLKFRAWHKTFEMMADVKSIDLHSKIVMLDAVTADGLPPRYSLDGVELMQYTGLLDKKGVEIYEGDLLTDHRLNPTGFGEISWPVEFKGGSFGIKGNLGVMSLYGADMQGLEVIGNIYENKDLIK